jgi:hypothetical protein
MTPDRDAELDPFAHYAVPPPGVPAGRPPLRFRHAPSPPTYLRYVARLVAFRGVAGRVDLRHPQRALDRYLRRWRRRALDLATEYFDDRGLADPVLGPRIEAVLNCPPAFLAVTPFHARPCGLPVACPSCAGRAAAGVWSGLDRDLYGDRPRRGARRAGTTMVVRAVTYTLARPAPAEWVAAEGNFPAGYVPLGAYFARRFSRTLPDRAAGRSDRKYRPRGTVPSRPTETARWRRLGVALGLDATRVALAADPELGPAWRLRAVQVLFLANEAAAGLLRSPYAATAPESAVLGRPAVTLRAVADPTRRAVATAVARALRYDASVLMGGHRGEVGHYLDARSHRRAVAVFGAAAALPPA